MTEQADLVLGIDVGGSSVKVWAAGPKTRVSRTAALPALRPTPSRAEFEPAVWWQIIRSAIQTVVSCVPDGARFGGLVVSSMRQAFVLVDGGGEIGRGVLNSDRRGGPFLSRLRELAGLYEVTGHWPAPELTLGKLLAIRSGEPGRWSATQRMLFVHDWLIWRMTGEQVTEISYACAGQLADVAARQWATDLMADLGLDPAKLAPVVESGTLVGGLDPGPLELPAGLPVYAGCGDTQLAAMGVGGLAPAVITVVAGSSTPVQAATAKPLADPHRRAWISTHARPDLWAAETNAGYPGTMAAWLRGLAGPVHRNDRPGAGGITATVATPEWSEHAWAVKAPMTFTGLSPASTPADLAQAVDEAHAFAVRANITGLQDALGGPAAEIIVTGGAAAGLSPLLADVLGRPVQIRAGPAGTMHAGWELVTGTPLPPADEDTAVAGPVRPTAGPAPYEAAYQRYLETHATLRAHLPEEDP